MTWAARVYNWVTDRNNGVPITASRMDAEFDNIITDLNNCVTADGQNGPAADLNMGGFKITNLGAPVASTDAATKGYVDTAITHIIAYNGSGGTYTGGSGITQLLFSGEVVDTLNEFTPGASAHFVPTITGLYMIAGNIAASPASTADIDLYIYKNASAFKHFYFNAMQASFNSLNFAILASLTALDSVDLRINSSVNITIGDDFLKNQLSIYRVK